MKTLYTISIIALVLIFASCDHKISTKFDPNDTTLAPKAPTNIRVSVNDNMLTLTWDASASGSISRYFIYRSFIDPDSVELYDSTSTASYTDDGVQNGIRYYYKITALSSSNLEGFKSVVVTAIPGVFSININNEAEYTNSRSVTVRSTVPSQTSHIKLSNSTDFSQSKWQTLSTTVSWELTAGDGVKTVYAQFKDSEGNESAAVFSDDITLDTRAQISAFTLTPGGSLFEPGDNLHFSLTAGETGGSASVVISGVETVDLYDNGSNGDAIAEDGIYELDYVIGPDIEVSDALVTANFEDRANNDAPSYKLSYRVTISVAPEAAVLSVISAEEDQIQLSWTAKSISDFNQYRLYRATGSGVDETSKLVTTITNQNTNSYTDSDNLEPNTLYYYKLYTYDDSGLKSASNEVNKRTLVNTAPEPVSLAIEILTAEFHLTWTGNDDSDFDSYRIYRSTSDISATNPNDADLLIINNSQNAATFTDTGVDTGITYNYRIFVFDKFGLKAGSNQVSGLLPTEE